MSQYLFTSTKRFWDNKIITLLSYFFILYFKKIFFAKQLKIILILILVSLFWSCNKIDLPKQKILSNISSSVLKTDPLSASTSLNNFEICAYLPYWGLANYQAYAYQNISTLFLHATISKASVLEKKGLIWSERESLKNKIKALKIA